MADSDRTASTASTAPAKEWDANSYDRVGLPQLEWAAPVVERLELTGSETVIDAGCGSGAVTELLLERLPEGRVIGLDASEAMVERANERFADDPRFEGRFCDLLELDLEAEADVVFSNAAFHWVLDHEELFRRLHRALLPGGRMSAQSGGVGNVAEVVDLAEALAAEEPYVAHFEGWSDPWLFASPEDTERRLREAGFSEERAWLEERSTDLDPTVSREFICTVVLRLHLQRLPEELHDPYLDETISRMANPHHLDYVRVNFDAVRPA